MKKLIITMILAALTFPVPALAQHKWKLVWSDEFDYKGLPDPAKWDYEVGFIRNHEEQYYTKARLENARVEDGMLVIEGRKEKFPNAKYSPNAKPGSSNAKEFAQYTSAALVTRNKAQWLYGRIEVRAKLPQGKGVWPAIWMLGDNIDKVGWPRCGEIDIMEFVGHTPDTIYGTAHFSKNGKHAASGNKLQTDPPSSDFHVYAVEWYPAHMDFFFDQQKYHTFPLDKATDKGDNPFQKPQYLLLNLALGGSWGKTIDDSILPQKYLIDYVRVYQDPSLTAPAKK